MHKDAELKAPAGHTVLVPAEFVADCLARGFELVRYLDEPSPGIKALADAGGVSYDDVQKIVNETLNGFDKPKKKGK